MKKIKLNEIAIGDMVEDGSYPFHPMPIISNTVHYFRVAGGGSVTKSKIVYVWRKRKNKFIKMEVIK